MRLSKKLLSVFVVIMLFLTPTLQCNAQIINVNTDNSDKEESGVLKEGLYKKNKNNVMPVKDIGGLSIIKEVNGSDREDVIQSFSTHGHTSDCYSGHRHIASCYRYVGNQSVPLRGYATKYWDDYGTWIRTTIRVSLTCSICRNNLIDYSVVDYTDENYGKDIIYGLDHRIFLGDGTFITAGGAYTRQYPLELAGRFDTVIAQITTLCNFLLPYGTIELEQWHYISKRFDNLVIPANLWPTIPYLDANAAQVYQGCPYCGGPNPIPVCGQTQDETTECNQVVTSITPTSTVQPIYNREPINTTAAATYLDGHTGIVNCTSNFNPNFEGTQIVTLTYSGLVDNAKKSGTKVNSITAYVDNNPPNINLVNITNGIDSIKLDVSATDTYALAANAYKYTIGVQEGAGYTTDWLSSPSYTWSGLISNKTYSYTVQVRDSAGHLATPKTGTIFTKSGVPSIQANLIESNKTKVVVTDSNSADTLYSVKVGDKYADRNGALSQAYSEFTLAIDPATNKKQLILNGLQGGTSYNITVSAKENVSGGFSSSNTVTIATIPDVPANLNTVNVTNSNIQLTWSKAVGAVSYELKRETLSSSGTVTETKEIKDVVANNYTDTAVAASQSYRYLVRCKNQYNQYSAWSATPLVVKTKPLPPEKVIGIKTEANGSKINLAWTPITGAVGYEVDFVCDGNSQKLKVSDSKCSIDTQKFDRQCSVKVRAYNVCSGSDVKDTSKWENPGTWSDLNTCYTDATLPSIVDVKVTNNSATVIWDANGNPDSVQIKLGLYYKNELTKEIFLIDDNLKDNMLSRLIDGLLPDTEYTFKIKAVNSVQKETALTEGMVRHTLIDPPSVPNGLRVSSTSKRINIFWNAADRAESYDIEKDGHKLATVMEGNSYSDEEVVAGKEYSYRIMAINTTGKSDWSNTIAAKLGEETIAPKITVATGSSISVSLAWTPIAGSTGYDIEVDGEKYATTQNTTYEHTGLAQGEEHTYKVRARSSIGYSAWSEPVSVTTQEVTPAIPFNINTVPTKNKILISWESASDATSYDVEINTKVYYQIQASEYLYSVVDTATGSAIHTIRVRSVNKGAVSEWSEAVKAETTGESGTPILSIPAKPKFTSCVTGAAIVSITWGKTNGAANYQLEADGTVVYTGTNTTYVHRGLKEKSKHQYRVRAGNISGYSEWSTVYEVITAFSNNTTPRNLIYFREDNTTTTIVWDGNTSIDKYRIEVNGVLQKEELTGTKTTIPTIPDKQYKIRVAAVIQEGENTIYDWSDEMSFNAPSNLPGTSKIKNITATSDKITLTWDEIIGANGYEIDINGTSMDVKKVLTYTITNLKASTSYSVKVRGYNSSGKGSWSEASTIMTNAGVKGVPINITVKSVATSTAATGCAIKIKWDVVTGAKSYEVEDQSGKLRTSNTNEIVVENLQPGVQYYYRVRALNDNEVGAWSSKISFIPTVTVPENIKLKIENEQIHLSWYAVGGAKSYEIEIDGVVYSTVKDTVIDFDYKVFYVQRAIRVRACNDTIKSEWSEVIIHNQPLTKSINVTNNEEFSVILPVKKVKMNKYKFTLTFDANELELLDAYEITSKAEMGTTYLKDLGVYLIQAKSDNITSITFVVDDDKKTDWTGIVSSMRFRSKKTGNATLKYGVTLK